MPQQFKQQLGPNVGIATEIASAKLQESIARDMLHHIAVNDTGSFRHTGENNGKSSRVRSIQIREKPTERIRGREKWKISNSKFLPIFIQMTALKYYIGSVPSSEWRTD
jgi:hypothetical protein